MILIEQHCDLRIHANIGQWYLCWLSVFLTPWYLPVHNDTPLNNNSQRTPYLSHSFRVSKRDLKTDNLNSRRLFYY